MDRRNVPDERIEMWRQMVKGGKAVVEGRIIVNDGKPIEIFGVPLSDFLYLLVQLNNTFFWLDNQVKIEFHGVVYVGGGK